MFPDIRDTDAVLTRFNRLISEILRGAAQRNTFSDWEVRLLLDIQVCDAESALRKGTLRRYQKAVQRHVESGRGLPFTLSEYLATSRARRCRATAA